MQLRPYQIEAVDRTFAAWESAQAVLGVAATGMGKTILFASVIKRHPGRVMVVADRAELIFQAVDKIKKATGLDADIEMADMRAAELSLTGKAKVIVSTIQTQTAGRNGGRMQRFNPDEFDLLIIDECFPAGTLIDKTPIEWVRVGDYVRSFNHATGNIESRRVTRVFRRRATSLVRVWFRSGQTIICTPDHPFFSTHQNCYIPARDLQEDDVALSDGIGFDAAKEMYECLKMVRVDRVEVLEPGSDGRFGWPCPDGWVYNLEVEGNNNYFAEGILVHNCHHATAASYRKVIEHYRQNANLRVLGVTATPDRSDEEALGQIFDEVAFEYDIRFGIEDGWLVPVRQTAVHVEGLDLSSCRTTAGDLNVADLTRVMEYETDLQQIAGPTIDLTRDGKKTLVFTVSLAHADRLCEILNRHRDGSARWVSGKTPKKERRQLFADYADGKFQYLLNVGVATEGFDEPGIEAIVMARPTKSRALYSQMAGRGMRPLPGVVDDPDMFGSPAMRRDAIANSAKRQIEIIDFVGNSGRHKLITTADILGGNYSDEVVDRARETVERDGSRNMMEALDEAEEEIRKEHEEAKRREAARRASLVAKATYTTSEVDPFDVFGITPWREKGWDKGRQPSEKMLAMLERQKVPTQNISYARARQLIAEITRRWDSDECSYSQAQILRQRGKPTNVTRGEAKRMIDEIAKRENWKPRKPRRKTASVTRY